MKTLNKLLLILILFSCDKVNTQFQLIDEDFCSSLHFDSLKLSNYLDGFDSLSSIKTGVYSLEEGGISLITRAWLSTAAEKSIDIQYFIFSGDNVGLIALDYLLRAADRGVKVRMLVDDIMVKADPEDLLALNSHPNLSIKIYNPNANLGKNITQKLKSLNTDFKCFNQRMHNKTFIVDDKVVITGGRNLADEYYDYDHEFNFRDRDVLLLGKEVAQVKGSFEEFWTNELSVPVDKVVQAPGEKIKADIKFEYLRQYSCDPSNFWPQIREKIKKVPEIFSQIYASDNYVWVDSIRYISDDPGKNENKDLKGGGKTTEELIRLIEGSEKEIWIESPYFVMTDLGKEIFLRAIERGVSINVITNSLASTDNLEAFSGFKRDRDMFIAMGINVFEFKPDAEVRYQIMTGALQKEVNYQPTFGLHAKSMSIDNEIAVIGTFNLDPRSANLNTECITIVYDGKIASRLSKEIRIDARPENSWQSTLEFNPDSKAGWRKNLGVWIRGLVPKSIL